MEFGIDPLERLKMGVSFSVSTEICETPLYHTRLFKFVKTREKETCIKFAMSTYWTSPRQSLTVEEKPLAHAGGEGQVHRITSPSLYRDACVKIFHPQQRTEQRRQKIEAMIRDSPPELSGGTYRICWPQELVYLQNKFVGFVMPLAFSDSVQVYELCQIRSKLPSPWPEKFDRRKRDGIEKRLKLCVNIAIAIHKIHSFGNYTLVDMKPQNMLVTKDGKVSLIDLDSIQIAKHLRVVHPGQVATPEYVPPEGKYLDPVKDYIPNTWDRFSMAVMFYEIIFGLHPFAATSLGDYASCTMIREKIQHGLFVHGGKSERYIKRPFPPAHDNFKRIPHPLRMLFLKAFEGGEEHPELRPTAEEWGKEMTRILKTRPEKPLLTPVSVSSEDEIFSSAVKKWLRKILRW